MLVRHFNKEFHSLIKDCQLSIAIALVFFGIVCYSIDFIIGITSKIGKVVIKWVKSKQHKRK